jgi:hypothetical protein
MERKKDKSIFRGSFKRSKMKNELLQFYTKNKNVILIIIIILLGYFSGMLKDNL